eukprot:355204_1
MAPSDLKTQSLHGVLLTFISGSLSAVLSSLIRWYSERSQYSVPNTDIKKTVNSIHSIQNIRYIHTKRSPISINSEHKPINIVHSTTPSKSLKSVSYGSLTTYLSTQHLFPPKHVLLRKLKPRNEPPKRSSMSQYFIEQISPIKLCIAIVLQSIFHVLSIYTFLHSQTQIHVTDTITLKSLSMIISAVLGWSVLAEKSSKYHVIVLILITISCAMIVQPSIVMQYIYSNDHPMYTWSGYILAIISALCGAFTSLFVRISSKAPPLLLIMSQCICNILGCFYMIRVWYDERIEICHEYEDIGYAAAGGLVLYLYTLAFIKGGQKLAVGAANMIQTGACVVVGVILFVGYVDNIRIIGICLTLVVMIGISVDKVKKTQNNVTCDVFVTDQYHQPQHGHGGQTGKDVCPNYVFDDNQKAGYTTLIL